MMPKNPIIISGPFTLRPLRKKDLPSIAHYINDKTIAHNLLELPYPYTIRDADAWFRLVRNRDRRKNRTDITLVIELDGEVIGGAGYHELSEHRGEIGYWLARKYWGQGIMTRVVKQLVKYGFEEIGLRRMTAHVFPYNKASMRVLEKAGFKFEGILRKNVKKGNRLIDEYQFAKVK